MAYPEVVIVFDVAPSIAIERYKQRGLSGAGMIIREIVGSNLIELKKITKNLVEYCKIKIGTK